MIAAIAPASPARAGPRLGRIAGPAEAD